MIRLDHQRRAPAQVIHHADRHVTKVGGNPDLHPFRPERKAYRIGSIVRNRKRSDLDISHMEAVTGAEQLQLRDLRVRSLLFTYRPHPDVMRGSRHEDGYV